MALDFDESKKKYTQYIARVKECADKIRGYGFNLEVEDDNELEAAFKISLEGSAIATLWWNVPSYLEFTPAVDLKEGAFSEDYVKNYDDWSQFLGDIEIALYEYINRA